MQRFMERLWRLQRHRNAARQDGQGLVEFALVLPILMLIMLLCLDFGRVFLGWVTLNNAARIGANYAAQNASLWGAATQTQYRALIANETSGINCTLPNPVADPTFPNGTQVGSPAVTALSCSFGLITPFIGALLGSNSLTVGGSATFPIRVGAIANLPGGNGTPPPAPIAGFTASPTTGLAPLTVSFTDASQNNQFATYSWDFGDGTTASGAPPLQHVYSSAGSYVVTLTLTNTSGSSQATATITVNPNPTSPAAGFYATVPSPCLTVVGPNSVDCGGSTGETIFYTWPMTVQFTDSSSGTGGATYSWDFGDGSTSTSANPQHVYASGGTYTVKLTLTPPSGPASVATRMAYINAGCVVPNFANTSTSAALIAWTGAHFSSGLYFWVPNGKGNGGAWQTTPPATPYNIGWQSQAGGLFDTFGSCASAQIGVSMSAVNLKSNPLP